VTEFALPTAGSAPQGIIVGPDQALWFTEFGSGRIGRLTTAGQLTELEYPVDVPNGGPWGIGVAPDNTIWFTEALSGNVVQLLGPAIPPQP
jgi:virginiamycin B lyase